MVEMAREHARRYPLSKMPLSKYGLSNNHLFLMQEQLKSIGGLRNYKTHATLWVNYAFSFPSKKYSAAHRPYL